MKIEQLPTVTGVFEQHDWHEVFAGAGDYSGVYEAVPGGGGQQVADITADRVATVLAFDAYSPEGCGSVDAVALVGLSDGTYAALTAWADTTGWGCQADAQWRTSSNKGDVIRHGLDNQGRERLGLVIDGATPTVEIEGGAQS